MNLIQYFAALLVLVRGDKVDEATFLKRVAICEACDKKKIDKKGVPYCGMCGCKVAKGRYKIFNLPIYRETARTGCKHPKRDGLNYGWPMEKIQ